MQARTGEREPGVFLILQMTMGINRQNAQVRRFRLRNKLSKNSGSVGSSVAVGSTAARAPAASRANVSGAVMPMSLISKIVNPMRYSASRSISSMFRRGNSGSPTVTALPAGSWPHLVAASMSVQAAMSPSPRREKTSADVFGMNGAM